MPSRLLRMALPVALVVLSLSPAAAQQSDSDKIKDLDRQWNEAVSKGDANAVADFYASDGRIMPAGAPMAQGHDAIRDVWQGFIGMQNFSLSFEPTSVTVSESGDIAYDIGTYELAFDSDKGHVEDKGKYVVVWTKEDGAWKVAADIFNSNGGM